jgi:gas vesicle protein
MNKAINIVTGFVVGSAIGAAAGILMAPAAGTETRRKIKDGALEVQDKAVTAMEDTEGAPPGGQYR